MSSNTDGLTGDVVRQGDSRYDMSRLGYNHLFRHSPEAIVYCADTQDVVNALAWARQNDVPVRVRSGGHCLEGWSSVDDGLVIDVSRLKSTQIDAATNIATVGAGLKQLEAVTALGNAGCATPTGTEGTVGLVGATLGGGFGLLTRKFGMASDNLLAAEVVVAPAGGGAETLIVDEENNTDLLWALRGAGNGNFGIVTSLTYRTYPLTQTIYVTASWSGLDSLPEVYEAWQQSAPHVDDRMTSQLEITRDKFELIGALAGGTAAEAVDILRSVLSVGAPEVNVQDGKWADTYAEFQIPPADELANWKFLSQFIYEPYPPEAVNLIRTFMKHAPTPESNYFTNAFGGAVRSSEPAGGSAFAHRNALYYAEPGAGWGKRGGIPAPDDPLTPRCEAWITEFGEALRPFVDGAYINVPNADMPEWETAYWGPNIDRLRTVKAKYDPDNVFSYEQSVKGAE